MKDKTVRELTTRLNELTVERVELEIKLMVLDNEYNEIVHELWHRIPSLKDDVNIQPKKRVRKYEDNRFIK